MNVAAASAQQLQQLDSLYTTLHQRGGFNGCVLVAEEGKPVYEKAFGYADLATRQVLTKQSVFELASVSKQFTAMAIMQLHQRGKLSYKDSLRSFFPQLHYSGVTVEDLLHHTTGLPEFLNTVNGSVDVNKISNNEAVLAALVKGHYPLIFKPGEQLVYTNTNYLLLAMIVEKVSGMSFAAYLKQYVFDPLGMENSRVYSRRSDPGAVKDYALGHL